MFTDIVGSTDLVGLIGDEAWSEVLRWHDRELRSAFSEHGGEEVDHTGDGFFVAFARSADAIEAAVDIQRRLVRHRKEHGFAPSVRIGLHTAEATRKGRNYTGQGVHVAARVGAAAGKDEILVSEGRPARRRPDPVPAVGAALREPQGRQGAGRGPVDRVATGLTSKVTMSSTFQRRLALIPSFPELDTERLHLRAFTDDDAPWYLEQFSRPETVEGQGYAPPDGLAGAIEEMHHYGDEPFRERRGIRWAICLKGPDGAPAPTPIGSCALLDWEDGPPSRAEVGYSLEPAHWGHGYVSEALQAIQQFGFEVMGLERIEALVWEHNDRSIQVLERLGYARDELLRDSFRTRPARSAASGATS